MGKNSTKTSPRPAPDVSVLLPVHNAERTLQECLASACAQQDVNLEILVILNGCTDRSATIAQTVAQTDARVRIETLADADIVAALNHGIKIAKAPYIARFDADDLMPSCRLKHQLEALDRHPEWVLCSGQVEHARLAGAQEGPGMKAHVDWLNSLTSPEALQNGRLIDAPVAHPAVTFRRALIERIGGYRSGAFPEDYDLWLRLFAEGHRFGTMPHLALVWRDHSTRLSRVDSRYADVAFRQLKHQHLLEGPLRSGRPCRVWGAGRFGKRHAKELLSAGAQVEDLIDIDPRKIGRLMVRNLPVVDAATLGPPDHRLILLAVASRGARPQIQHMLNERGYLEGRDYLALQ